MSAPPRRSEHSPATLRLLLTVYAVGGPHKTTTPITVGLLLNAATAEPTSGFDLDLRYLSTFLMAQVTRKVYGRERSDGTDGNGFLSNSTMINATYTVVLDRIWINRVASDLCFSLHPHWPARSGFSLYIQTLVNSTSKMTLMECGHTGIFVLMSQRVLRR